MRAIAIACAALLLVGCIGPEPTVESSVQPELVTDGGAVEASSVEASAPEPNTADSAPQAVDSGAPDNATVVLDAAEECLGWSCGGCWFSEKFAQTPSWCQYGANYEVECPAGAKLPTQAVGCDGTSPSAAGVDVDGGLDVYCCVSVQQ